MSELIMSEIATPSTPSTGKIKLFPPTASIPTIGILDDAGVLGKLEWDGAGTLRYKTPGAWTPGISFGGGTTGITYGAQTGRYERIGNTIRATGKIDLTNKGSSTGVALITGLPVVGLNLSNYFQCVNLRINGLNTVTTNMIMGYVSPNETTIALEYLAAGAVVNMTDAIFQNTTSIMVVAVYEVA